MFTKDETKSTTTAQNIRAKVPELAAPAVTLAALFVTTEFLTAAARNGYAKATESPSPLPSSSPASRMVAVGASIQVGYSWRR